MNFKYLTWTILLLLPGLSAAQAFRLIPASVSGTSNQGLYSTGMAWGDYDGDGDLDLYVTNWAASITDAANALYSNNGDGSFTNVATDLGVDLRAYNSTGAAWGDYNNDGHLDLYVANFFPSEQDFLYENQGGSFTEVGRARGMINVIAQGAVTSVAWGDYNNDGLLDLYLGKYYYDNELYQNDESGIFRPVTDLGVGDKRDTQDVDWVDYDNDGDLDLYLVNRQQENALYRNDLDADTGTVSFAEIACVLSIGNTEIGQSGTWGDYDNDGDLDLYLANVGANALYRNDGGDRFVDVAEDAGVRLSGADFITAMAAWADYDGDGDLGLYLASGGDRQEQRDILYANSGDGTFSNVTTAEGLLTNVGASAHMAVAWGDYDGTGSPDLYATNGWGQGNRLFENGTSGSRFLKVRVQGNGSSSNRDGIGARVSLFDASDQLWAYRQVLGGDGATGLIFGVEEGQTYRVEVVFPGGAAVEEVIGDDIRGSDLITIMEPEL